MAIETPENAPLLTPLDGTVSEAHLHISRSHTAQAVTEMLSELAPHIGATIATMTSDEDAKTIGADFFRSAQVRRLPAGFTASFEGTQSPEPQMFSGIHVDRGTLTITKDGNRPRLIRPGENFTFSDLTNLTVDVSQDAEILQIVSPPSYQNSSLWLPEKPTEVAPRRFALRRDRLRAQRAALSMPFDDARSRATKTWSKVRGKYRYQGEPLRIAFVHAHPDDESSKGAAAMARYIEQGVDVSVITCTGGEEGSILNPTMPEMSPEELQRVRAQEMANARDILGFEHHWLGYRDSGMPADDIFHPESLVAQQANAERALLRKIREIRPHVVVTYDETGGYPHPDHVASHQIGQFAFYAADDIEKYPEEEYGPGWSPLTLFYQRPVHKGLFETAHHYLTLAGRPSPFNAYLAHLNQNPEQDPGNRISTWVKTQGRHVRKADQALTAHATQVDEQSIYLTIPWHERVRPGDGFELAATRIALPRYDKDLLAGIVPALRSGNVHTATPVKPRTRPAPTTPWQRLRATARNRSTPIRSSYDLPGSRIQR